MKTTGKVSLPPASGEAEGKNEAHDARQSDQLKERQKIPMLPGISTDGSWSLIVPANELEFANFYHL